MAHVQVACASSLPPELRRSPSAVAVSEPRCSTLPSTPTSPVVGKIGRWKRVWISIDTGPTPSGRRVKIAIAMAASSTVMAKPPCTVPIGFRCSAPGMARSRTMPSATSVSSNGIRLAMGGGGAAPDASASISSRPVTELPTR